MKTINDAQSLMIKQLTCNGKLPVSSFNLDSTFNSQNVDSLDVVELTMAFEEEFDIQIQDHLIDEMDTPNQFIDKVMVIYNGIELHSDECLG